jgi:hypothetical protein
MSCSWKSFLTDTGDRDMKEELKLSCETPWTTVKQTAMERGAYLIVKTQNNSEKQPGYYYIKGRGEKTHEEIEAILKNNEGNIFLKRQSWLLIY